MNSLVPGAAGKLTCHRALGSRGKCSARTFRTPQRAAAAAALQVVPLLAAAQSSPFMTGASALQTNILAWLTPIAVILVMVLGAMAMANRIARSSSTCASAGRFSPTKLCAPPT
jgi:hypothetical protein